MYIDIRQSVANHCRRMLGAGLTTGSGGNISVRLDADRYCISPTGISYDRLRAEDMPIVDSEYNVLDGTLLPSSELRMHLGVYLARPDVHAIVHTHSPYATTFACLREEIPAVHYLVGFAGTHVPVAPYATYGSEALARGAAETLAAEFHAVLLANHGLLAVGASLEKAFAVAEEIELVARLHYQARSIGTPVLLDEEEMRRVMEKFGTYGVQPGVKEKDR